MTRHVGRDKYFLKEVPPVHILHTRAPPLPIHTLSRPLTTDHVLVGA